MSSLTKSKNGFIFSDDFKEKTLLWTLSPSDNNCLFFGDNGLKINHNKKYIMYTITEPDKIEYTCIFKIDHIPQNQEDVGGIILYSTNNEYAECQTFLSENSSEISNSILIESEIKDIISKSLSEANIIQWTENGENVPDISYEKQKENFIDSFYKYIKINKEKNKYVFYASENGKKWIDVGNVKFANSVSIGFFLYGTTNEDILNNSHFYVNDFYIYSSKYIKIYGISREYEIEILNEDNDIILRTDSSFYKNIINRSSRECIINTNSFLMPIKNAKIKIYEKDKYEKVINVFNVGDIYGGDKFILDKNIKVFIDNRELNKNELHNIGEFYHGSYYIKLSLLNCEKYNLINTKVKVIKFSEFYEGEQIINIALKNDTLEIKELEYKKEIIIPEIKQSEGKEIFIKLSDEEIDNFYNTANSYRFKIIIE